MLSNGRIVGEVENVISGLTNRFVVKPRGRRILHPLPRQNRRKRQAVVTGTAPANAAGVGADLDAAVATYRAFVEDKSAELVTATKALQGAIKAGNVDQAKEKYIAARPFYERSSRSPRLR